MSVARACVSKLLDIVFTLLFHISLHSSIFLDTNSVGDGSESEGSKLSHMNVNTLRPRQNGRHFPDDIINCIFVNGNV